MKKKETLEERVKRIHAGIVKEATGEHSISVSKDEHYAIIMLLQYAINKRLGEKVTGLDYTRLSNLKNKLNSSYE